MHCMPTSELRNKARPEFCGSLGTGYRPTGSGRLSRNNTKITVCHPCGYFVKVQNNVERTFSGNEVRFVFMIHYLITPSTKRFITLNKTE